MSGTPLSTFLVSFHFHSPKTSTTNDVHFSDEKTEAWRVSNSPEVALLTNDRIRFLSKALASTGLSLEQTLRWEPLWPL